MRNTILLGEPIIYCETDEDDEYIEMYEREGMIVGIDVCGHSIMIAFCDNGELTAYDNWTNIRLKKFCKDKA